MENYITINIRNQLEKKHGVIFRGIVILVYFLMGLSTMEWMNFKAC